MESNSVTESQQKKISLRDLNPVDFLGVNDTNLKILQQELAVEIFVRGNDITLSGEQQEITEAETIVGEMLTVLSRKKYLDKEDVVTIIKLTRAGTTPVGEPGLGSVILFTRSDVIKPRTEGQEAYFEAVKNSDLTFALGPAGTGKTYLAVAFAVSAFKNREVKKIILTRPAVESGERLGFLPGDLKEKIGPYLTPLYDALYDMLPADRIRQLLDQKSIEIVPLAYMRGRTLDNAFIILDEAQNTTPIQMKMFLTRMGVNSKVIVTGDLSQVDLPVREESGLLQSTRILKSVPGIATVTFTDADVVRHKLVRHIIQAYDREINGKI
ncbi:MAG: PhoH family protein [Candidatus Marinimicrobia bacterium]|nr:PhoH family protein [Candidatus Neomarinimicrobiota bacterium]